MLTLQDWSGQDNQVLLDKLKTSIENRGRIKGKLDQLLESHNGKQGLHAGQKDILELGAAIAEHVILL